WHENYNGAPTDGTAWLNGGDQLNKRAVRGGSLDNGAIYCRSASRGYFGAAVSDYYNGFRVVV
ncbi:MAG: formylglycine-generating enzyme family protein, partial [Pseudanabaena sp. M110S1SP2A07QC]|nr:formylglycine-generating enzyme family protein [Pseudanabaena sp. M110S1SP2A07QC]